MIIKITPENDEERGRIQEVEHVGVKEFFIFGNKKDTDSDLIDFHDWNGSYRYLVGSLYYFTNMLSDEMGGRNATKAPELKLQVESPQIEAEANQDGLIKKSGTQDGQIEGVVEVRAEDMQEKPHLTVINQEEEEAEGDSSKGAED